MDDIPPDPPPTAPRSAPADTIHVSYLSAGTTRGWVLCIRCLQPHSEEHRKNDAAACSAPCSICDKHWPEARSPSIETSSQVSRENYNRGQRSRNSRGSYRSRSRDRRQESRDSRYGYDRWSRRNDSRDRRRSDYRRQDDSRDRRHSDNRRRDNPRDDRSWYDFDRRRDDSRHARRHRSGRNDSRDGRHSDYRRRDDSRDGGRYRGGRNRFTPHQRREGSRRSHSPSPVRKEPMGFNAAAHVHKARMALKQSQRKQNEVIPEDVQMENSGQQEQPQGDGSFVNDLQAIIDEKNEKIHKLEVDSLEGKIELENAFFELQSKNINLQKTIDGLQLAIDGLQSKNISLQKTIDDLQSKDSDTSGVPVGTQNPFSSPDKEDMVDYSDEDPAQDEESPLVEGGSFKDVLKGTFMSGDYGQT